MLNEKRSKKLSAQEQALDNQARLIAFFAEVGDAYPKRPNGEPDVKALSARTGINRASFYGQAMRDIVRDHTGQLNEEVASEEINERHERAIRKRDARILELEQALSAAQAEAETLRTIIVDFRVRLARFRELEAILIEQGVIVE
ncbi:MAG TPA: hypothetical protein PKE58_10800 [Acidobacteriota bacterium]|nr:hypothetical protein [Acidobacteriota bacterium]